MAQVQLDAAPATRLAAQLVDIGERLLDLDRTHAAAAELIGGGATPPRRTGRLAASVRADVGPGGWTLAYGVPYATFVHWGAPRRHVRAQPWLLRQLNTDQSELERLYGDHARDALTT